MTSLILASDHAGYAMKEQVKRYIGEHYPNYIIQDIGPHSDNSVDYPDYGKKAAEAVVQTQGVGIILCGSGIGISIAANRVAGARAALCTNATMAALAREHNDANMLAIGARLTDEETVTAMIDAFLTTAFAGGRHKRRVKMLG